MIFFENMLTKLALARQTRCHHLVEAYRNKRSEPYQSLIMDMRPKTLDYLKFTRRIKR